MKVNLKNLLFLVFVFGLFWSIPLDPDLGWHLRYGKELFETGKVFRDNRIGYFLTDHLWTLNYSLYQWLVFVLEKYVGVWSLSVLHSVLVVSMFVIIKKVFRLSVTTVVMVVLYFRLISLPVFGLGLRPQIISTVFVVLTYAILLKRRWWWLVPLSFIWANTHGAFILELILMGIYFGQLLIKKDKELLKYCLIGVVTMGVSLLNPFGVGIYREALRHSWYPLNKLIAEWLPPANLGIVVIFSSVISVLAIILAKTKNILKKENVLFLVLSFLAFLGLALKARRNLSLFGVVYIFLVLGMIEMKIKDGWWTWLGLMGIVLFLVLSKTPKFNWDLIEKERNYPMEAVEYIKNSKCQNIYNTYEWGGYLVWKLTNKKFFVDGRMPAWESPENQSPYTTYLEIIQARPGWSDRLLGYGTDCLLISKGTFLDLEIRDEEKGWQDTWVNTYEDEKSVVYELRQ